MAGDDVRIGDNGGMAARGRGMRGWVLAAMLGVVGCVGGSLTDGQHDAVRDLRSGLATFPGAQGFGTTTPAGRRGAVLRVTSLADRGPGTLREALQTAGPRTVVFEVGGVIQSTESWVIGDPYVTVAGQTAPSPGITLSGAGVVVATHDVLLQHLRIRAGDAPDGPDPGGRDSLSIVGAADGSLDVHDVVVDHCSISWAIDEGVSTWNPGVRDITIRRSLISENLSHSLHPKGEHSKGLLVGDHTLRIAIVENILAQNVMRNPILKGDVSALVASNIIYNPACYAVHIDDPEGSGPTLATIAGNLLIPGPNTSGSLALVEALGYVKTSSAIYLLANNTGGRGLHKAIFTPAIFHDLPDYQASPVWVMPLDTPPPSGLPTRLSADAGARPRDRDAVDTRVIADMLTGGGSIIDSPAQVGGLPAPTPTTRPLTLPDDPGGDADGDGYTNLENWLHSLAAAQEHR